MSILSILELIFNEKFFNYIVYGIDQLTNEYDFF
jgi:hypothetical protein